MALEQLISSKRLKQSPLYAFFMGFACTMLGVLLAVRIFPEYASLVMVTFCILPIVGVMYKLVSDEEQLYEMHAHILWRNPLLIVYAMLFLGMVAGFTLSYAVLPHPVADTLFSAQQVAFRELGGPTASALAGICDERVMREHGYSFCQSSDLDDDGEFEAVYYSHGSADRVILPDGESFPYKPYVFSVIFLDNMRILLIVFLLSLLLGAGSLFVLAWNASVLGVFFGTAIRGVFSSDPLAYVLPVSVWTIWLHGVPEFFAFFLSAVAGGVLGVVLIKRKAKEKIFWRAVRQCVIVFLASIILLVAAAGLELLVQ